MLFVGVVLARAPAAAIFLTHISSVNFVPGLFLAPVPELSRKAITTWFLFQAPLLSVVFIDQTNSWLSVKSWIWCYLLWESSLAPQADLCTPSCLLHLCLGFASITVHIIPFCVCNLASSTRLQTLWEKALCYFILISQHPAQSFAHRGPLTRANSANEWMAFPPLGNDITTENSVPSHYKGNCPYIPGSMLQEAKPCALSTPRSKCLEIGVFCASITLAGIGQEQTLCLGFASLFGSRYWILGQMLNWLKLLIWARCWIGLRCLSQLQSQTKMKT